MMNKFDVNIFGAPVRVRGVSQPMDASISRLGKIIQISPSFPAGITRPFENYANIRPKAPVYQNMPRLPGDGGYDSSGINPGGGPLRIPPFLNAFV